MGPVLQAEMWSPYVLRGYSVKGKTKEIGKKHSFFTVFSKDERGLQRLKLPTRQIEALFELSIRHPLCRFPDSSHADSKAPSLLLSISPALRAGNLKGHCSRGDTSLSSCAWPFPPSKLQGGPQKRCSDALSHQALGVVRHFFQGTEANLQLLLKGHGQSCRGVLVLTLQILGDIIL